MNWTILDTWIVVTGVLGAMSCALVGNFLVLRRMSMMGDAISHAVLPGLALAFLLTGSRGNAVMFVGAAIVGVLTALFTQWIHTLGKVEESAAMGVVFTAMFAAGLILIVRAADAVDLDPGCVLYGAIELTPLDTVAVFGRAVPRAALTLGGVFLFNLLFTLLFYKELRITAFDPALATALGFNATLMHYLLMMVVAITTVASFESVGSILVIAMLIVPAAAAHLLTDRYAPMLIISVVVAMMGAVLGHVAAITVPSWFGFTDTSTAGMMAVAVGAIFLGAMLLAPRHGVLSRVIHRLQLRLRIAREDVLGLLYRLEESRLSEQTPATALALHRALDGRAGVERWAIGTLRWSGLTVRDRGIIRLTPKGRVSAQQLVRSHRLWESFLAKHFVLPTDHLHDSANRTEHYLTAPMQAAMVQEIADAAWDPHGRQIPNSVVTTETPAEPPPDSGGSRE